MEDISNRTSIGLATGTEISKYVKQWLDEYSRDPEEKPIVLEKMKVIFSKESEYKTKVLDGNEFITVFKEKVREKRLKNLKMFLMEIDSDRYDKVNYQW